MSKLGEAIVAALMEAPEEAEVHIGPIEKDGSIGIDLFTPPVHHYFAADSIEDLRTAIERLIAITRRIRDT